MKRLNTFSGQIITSENLEYLQTTKEEAISERYSDIITDGIFRFPTPGRSNEFEIIPNGQRFDIGPGVGKVSILNGDVPGSRKNNVRIVIPEGENILYDSGRPLETPPKSTGNKFIPLADNSLGVENYIWLRYLQTQDPGVISQHWQTGQTYFTNVEDGYEIIVNTDASFGDNNDYTLLIGKIVSPGSGNDISLGNISYAGRVYASLTTGFISELDPSLIQYQKDSHSNGIISAEVEENYNKELLHLGYIEAFDIGAYAILEDGEKLAQGFTPTSAMVISSIELNLQAEMTAPVGNLKVYIYDDNAGVPGNIIAESSVSQEVIPTGEFKWVTFNITIPATPVNLSPGTRYWIVLEKVTDDGVIYWASHYTGTGPGASGYGGTTYYEAKLAVEPTPTWDLRLYNDLHFKIFEWANITAIKTLDLTFDNTYNPPALFVEQLQERNGVTESVYINGIRIDYLTGEEEIDNKVRALQDISFLDEPDGVFEVYINELGEVHVDRSTPSDGFLIWKVTWRQDVDGLEAWTDLEDQRAYRLIAGNDIRGVDINDDNEFDFQENAVFEKDVNVKGDVITEEMIATRGNIVPDSGIILGERENIQSFIDAGYVGLNAIIKAEVSAPWTQKANISSREEAYAFSIGEKGYVGGGRMFTRFKDLYEYDPVTDTWTQKANSPDFITAGVGFSVNGKGYAGMGYDSPEGALKTLYEYNPDTNTWSQKANLPGVGRIKAIAFTIGDKGYVGLGERGIIPRVFLSDFYQYDPGTDSWSSVASFFGGARRGTVGCSVAGKGYVGLGYGGDNYYYSDFYQYDPGTDSWSLVASFPGAAREGAVAFSIINTIFVGSGYGVPEGYHKDFFAYNSLLNEWVKIIDMDNFRANAVSFAIRNKGYVVSGFPTYTETWEYNSGFLFPYKKG